MFSKNYCVFVNTKFKSILTTYMLHELPINEDGKRTFHLFDDCAGKARRFEELKATL